jgi:hypothetical protein
MNRVTACKCIANILMQVTPIASELKRASMRARVQHTTLIILPPPWRVPSLWPSDSTISSAIEASVVFVKRQDPQITEVPLEAVMRHEEQAGPRYGWNTLSAVCTAFARGFNYGTSDNDLTLSSSMIARLSGSVYKQSAIFGNKSVCRYPFEPSYFLYSLHYDRRHRKG